MDCSHFEDLLSEYMDGSLPDQEKIRVGAHLASCPSCSLLLDEMQSTVLQCRNYPALEIDVNLLEKILLRTSGRPRHRSIKEIWLNNFIKPLLTPRFAIGAGLATLFLILMIPRMSPVLSALSPPELFRLADRGIQEIYVEGLKAYKTKNDLKEQFSYLKNKMYGKLRFLIEKIDIPIEDSGKSMDPNGQKDRAPKEKSSVSRLLSA
jgi:hypothetical protein